MRCESKRPSETFDTTLLDACLHGWLKRGRPNNRLRLPALWLATRGWPVLGLVPSFRLVRRCLTSHKKATQQTEYRPGETESETNQKTRNMFPKTPSCDLYSSRSVTSGSVFTLWPDVLQVWIECCLLDTTFATITNINATIRGLRHCVTGDLYISPPVLAPREQPSLACLLCLFVSEL
jgi:hypothetical protein